MGGLKSLAKDTAIYGVSSIVGRFLNYLLVPIYTISMPASTEDMVLLRICMPLRHFCLYYLHAVWKPDFSVLPIRAEKTR